MVALVLMIWLDCWWLFNVNDMAVAGCQMLVICLIKLVVVVVVVVKEAGGCPD